MEGQVQLWGKCDRWPICVSVQVPVCLEHVGVHGSCMPVYALQGEGALHIGVRRATSPSPPQGLGEGRWAPISCLAEVVNREEGLHQTRVSLSLLSPHAAPCCFPTVVPKGVTQHFQASVFSSVGWEL